MVYRHPIRPDDLYVRPLRPNELYHHGVKGQKWGVKNGPPYPIDRSNQVIPKSVKMVAKNGLRVTGISDHARDQAKTRNVRGNDIADAIKNPLHVDEIKTDEYGRRSQRFIGNSATVNVNPDTGVISTLWATGRKKREKYSKGR